MRKAVGLHPGILGSHVQVVELHVQSHALCYRHGPLVVGLHVDHGAVQIQELGRALMHVHCQIDALTVDQVVDSRADHLCQDTVFVSVVEPVHVADLGDLGSHQLAARGPHVVGVVRPLVHRVRKTVAHAEGAHAAVIQDYIEEVLHAVQRRCVRKAALVGPWDDEQPSLRALEVLCHGDGCNRTGALVRMRSAQNQHVAAGHPAVQDIDLGIQSRSLET